MSGNGNGKYYGKYRGTVINNIDPNGVGRLLLEVPDVLGVVPSSWALPCTPLAGPTGPPMGVYMVPPIGAGVWVEFEQGDPNYPVWVGCRWGAMSDVPPLVKMGLPVSPSIVLQTAAQNSISISDLPGPTGGIMLKSTTGAMIVVNDMGIIIQNGKGASITMTGPAVTVNQGALIIT
ncbi:MAG TPA: phage baseplate assembly protein V [Candidatus Sulfotelmatobacter sp.]|nr:phage baseplate assembly protein V [Candidatus Sulfotelmatobacter sp.]